MTTNPAAISRLMVRATNWLGDAVMSLPSLRAIRDIFPNAHISLVARPWVADLYARESSIDAVIPYMAQKGLGAKMDFATALRRRGFDGAILLQNAFDAALMAWLAKIPVRIGYSRDARGWLLTQAVAVPEPGEIPRHERYYYLELLRRAGLMEAFPRPAPILFERLNETREAGAAHLQSLGIEGPVMGVSPGAAYGSAKQWLPERFAEAAVEVARRGKLTVLVFGSAGERELAESVAAAVRRSRIEAHNLAGKTTLRQFVDVAAVCQLFLTNDSGAMHVAAALAAPTVAVFGATDDTTTGPSGPMARVIREYAECSPCLLRECPIDHRCMTRVTSERVVEEAVKMLEEGREAWTHGRRS